MKKTLKTGKFTLLLLSGLLVGRVARADDPPPLPGYPFITSADSDGTNLFIVGKNFGVAAAPKVQLGSFTLTPSSYSPTVIVAPLPSSAGPASYPLWVQSFVSTPWGTIGLWTYLGVTLGAVGPQGPQGVAGPTGPQGPKGDPGASVVASSLPVGDPNCPAGGSKFVVGTQTSYACNGSQGIQGLQGPPGSSGLSSFNNLNGLSCSIAGTAGTISLTFASNGVATLTCNLPPPPPPPPPLTQDAYNSTFANPNPLGTLVCGSSMFLNGTTFPAGTEDWFVFTIPTIASTSPLCGALTISITASSGVGFDLKTDATNFWIWPQTGLPVANFGISNTNTLQVQYTNIAAGTYYIRIHGLTSSTTGTWQLSISS
jgi:hypothetical protein